LSWLFDWWRFFNYFDSAQYKLAQDKFFVLTDWGVLGGEVHAMWWVEYILNAIVVETVKRGGAEKRGGRDFSRWQCHLAQSSRDFWVPCCWAR